MLQVETLLRQLLTEHGRGWAVDQFEHERMRVRLVIPGPRGPYLATRRYRIIGDTIHFLKRQRRLEPWK